MRFTALVPATLLFSGAAATQSYAAAVSESRPNFVIILADDLGYGDLSCFGNTKYQTPNLDRMSSEGVRMTSFYVTCPACSPSRASILTGKYPLRVGIPNVLGTRSYTGITTGTVTLPALLKKQGYNTQIVGKWHLGHRPEYLPTRHGFDAYFGLPYSNDMTPVPLMRDEKIIEQQVDQTKLTRRYTEEALKFIDKSAQEKKPFFLYLAHNFPHVPLHVSEKFNGASGAGLYGDVVQEVDWSVGQVLEKLRKLGVDKNTMVVFTSDNGPWLIQGANAGSAGVLRDGKGTPYEGGVREPFIAWWPGKLQGGKTYDTAVISMDLLPTICRLAGTELPAAEKFDGKDIWAELNGAPLAEPRMFFFPEYYGKDQVGAVRYGNWKLILEYTGKQTPPFYELGTRTTTATELFDLSKDISEKNNVAAQHKDLVTSLTKIADEFRSRITDEDPWKGVRANKNFTSLDYVTPGNSLYLGDPNTTAPAAAPAKKPRRQRE